MVENRYDFRVGDIIIEEDKTWDIPSSCFMYYILDVSPEIPTIMLAPKKLQLEPVTGSHAFFKESYLPEDCSITVMFTNVSGNLTFESASGNGEGVLQKQFLFSKSVWDKATSIRKIRGEEEFYLQNLKWVKR